MNEAATILPNIDIYAIRLLPGQDLIKSLQHIAEEKSIDAGWIASAVGSLTEYSIRFANQSQPAHASGHFEIIALNGTVSAKGCHLHIMIADEKGDVKAGHLTAGTIIYTTAEVIIGFSNKYVFNRINDGSTPWKELSIEEKHSQ